MIGTHKIGASTAAKPTYKLFMKTAGSTWHPTPWDTWPKPSTAPHNVVVFPKCVVSHNAIRFKSSGSHVGNPLALFQKDTPVTNNIGWSWNESVRDIFAAYSEHGAQTYPAMIPNIINKARNVLQRCSSVKRGAVCDLTDRTIAMTEFRELPSISIPSIEVSVTDETFTSKTIGSHERRT